MKKLNENECLVRLEGMPVNEEPCYIIVDVKKVAPANIVTVNEGEVLVCAGSIANAEQRQAAYERYKLAKESGTTPPRAGAQASTPFYIKVPMTEVDPKTGMLSSEMSACKTIAKEALGKMKQNIDDNGGNIYVKK